MAEQAGELSQEEKQRRNEMLFTLSELDGGTLAMVVTPNEWKRNELYHFLKNHLKEYEFFDLDLTPYNYNSLYKALMELLPSTVLQSQPVQYLVSITGLESSMFTTEDGRIEFSPLLAQLNFERELIFNQPFIIVLWASEGFDWELRRKAPDLMQWMSKRFVFEEKGSDGMKVAEAAIEYGVVEKRGRIPERLERIGQLQDTWERLSHDNKDRIRLVKDKIDLLLLLGKEYAAAFEFHEAERAFKRAIALNFRMKIGRELELCYELGYFYWQFNRYDLALENFQQALVIAQEKDSPKIGDIYHMLGMVYAGKLKSGEALTNYQQALDWYIKTGNEYELGSTYHQIGIVYEEQRKWNEALASYQQALDWKMKTGNEYKLGSTYHQIGRVYEGQRKWSKALVNYQQALDWKIRTGNKYALGSTYHQIGMIYQEQRKWDEALANYQLALDLYSKTGNEYELGGTYHQIGMLYEDRREWDEALANYRQALNWHIKTGNEYALGSTYFQMGMIYEKQRKWDEALANYQQALDWYIKVGNEYELGGTYHQIGMVYEEQNKYSEAQEWYEKSVESAMKFDHSDLPTARESLSRIQQKISEHPPTP